MESIDDVKVKLPMLISFVEGRPVLLQNTDIELHMSPGDFLLYVRVMKMYVDACYRGAECNLKVLSEIWPLIYDKVGNILKELPEEKKQMAEMCQRVLSMFDKCRENIYANINDDLAFVCRTLRAVDTVVPEHVRKEKELVFANLWDLTDRLLFIDCAYIFAPVSMSLLLLTKLVIVKHCVIQQQCTSSVEISVNWSASFIINFIINSDRVFDELVRRTINPGDLECVKLFVKRSLESGRIMPRIQDEITMKPDVVYNWTRAKYLNIHSTSTKELRLGIINQIMRTFDVNTRMACAFEMWILLESCFPVMLSNDVSCISEMETLKYFTEKNIIQMLRNVRNKLRVDDIKMVDDNNVNDIFDAEILAHIISILTAMLAKPSNKYKTIVDKS